jgi:hypothetical protein
VGSRELRIDLASGRPGELFKWFVACLLFGKPIQQAVAARTYREFAKARLLTPRAILEAGWDRLVEVLDRGHYVRFDFSTATKLLDVCTGLLAQYGRLDRLLQQSTSQADVVRRLRTFKGVGPTTARIFLREVAALWPGYGRPSGGAASSRSDRHRPTHVGHRDWVSRRPAPVRSIGAGKATISSGSSADCPPGGMAGAGTRWQLTMPGGER